MGICDYLEANSLQAKRGIFLIPIACINLETRIERERGEGLEWFEIFEVKPVEPQMFASVACHCGNGRCERAKKFKCTCQCHHANHGRAYKSQLSKLDEVLGNEQEVIQNGLK
jgi:hypothetical protein